MVNFGLSIGAIVMNMKVNSDIYESFRIVIYVCIQMLHNILMSKLINSNSESEYKSQLNNKKLSNTDINILI